MQWLCLEEEYLSFAVWRLFISRMELVLLLFFPSFSSVVNGGM